MLGVLDLSSKSCIFSLLVSLSLCLALMFYHFFYFVWWATNSILRSNHPCFQFIYRLKSLSSQKKFNSVPRCTCLSHLEILSKIPDWVVISNTHLLLIVLRAGGWGDERSGSRQGHLLRRALFLTCIQLLPAVSSHGRDWNCGLSSSSYKSTNLIMGAPPLWPHLHLITTQSLRLQMPLHWGLGFQHVHWGRDTVSP